MKRSRMIITGAATIGIAAATFAVRSARGDSEDDGPPSVVVATGDVVQKALAVGTIEPRTEVEVKSKVGGVVRRLMVDEGGYVGSRTGADGGPAGPRSRRDGGCPP